MLFFRRTQDFNPAAHQLDPLPAVGKVIAGVIKRFSTQTGNVNHGKLVVSGQWLRLRVPDDTL